MLPTGIPFDNFLKVVLPENIQNTDIFAKLNPGDILKGSIIKSNPSEGTTVARFSGQEISLPHSSNLSAGQSVAAEVVKVSNQLILQVGVPKTSTGKADSLVLNLPETLKSDHVLSLAKPGDIISGTVVKNLGQNQSLIRFGDLDVSATSSRPLAAGETISAKLLRTLPQLTLKVLEGNIVSETKGKSAEVPSGKTGSAPFQEVTVRLNPNHLKSGTNSPHFKEGQLLEVKVNNWLFGNKAVLDIGGKLVEATVSRGVETGKSMLMFVDSQSSDLVLKSLDPKPGFNVEKAINFIRDILPGKEPLDKVLGNLLKLLSDENLPQALKSQRSFFQGLRDSLNGSILSKPGNPDGANLQKSFDLSGQNYEARVKTALERGVPADEIRNTVLKGDVKGELLKASAFVENKISLIKGEGQDIQAQIRELRTLANALRSGANQIELTQVMNAVNQREDGTVFFQVPYMSDDGKLKKVEVYVRRNGQKKSEASEEAKEDCNVTLLLDMTSLGALRADVNIQKNMLQCKITSPEEEVAGFLEAGLPILESKIKELGYMVKLESGITRKEEILTPPIQEKEPLNNLGLLDVKV